MARPDGKGMMLTGKIVFLVGMIAFAIMNFRAFAPGFLGFHPVSEALGSLGIAGIFLGPIIWAAGKVIFALSFIDTRSHNDRP